MLYVYLFHGHVSCLPFSRGTFLRSATLHVGTSNCFMSTYFTDMRLVYLFHSILFTFLVHYIWERLIALSLLISPACFLSTFITVYFFTSWYIIYRNVLLLYVYLFHGHASCLHFSQYTILRSSTLYALCLLIQRTCVLSTFFMVYYFTFWYIICRNF